MMRYLTSDFTNFEIRTKIYEILAASPHQPKWKRKGKFETRSLVCTDLNQTPRQILEWFLLRWQVEVTFQEVRAHLGVETQRQWSDLAIARTTPEHCSPA